MYKKNISIGGKTSKLCNSIQKCTFGSSSTTSIIFGKSQCINRYPVSRPRDVLLNNRITEKLDVLLDMYSLGQYGQLSDAYDRDVFIDIYNLIDKIDIRTPFGSAMRVTYTNTLDGLSRALVQYNKYLEALATIETLSKRVEILDDEEKLNEYIEQLNTSFRNFELFDIDPVQSIGALLKPEYAEYVKRYGIPDDGVFEADKLYDIMKELNMV